MNNSIKHVLTGCILVLFLLQACCTDSSKKEISCHNQNLTNIDGYVFYKKKKFSGIMNCVVENSNLNFVFDTSKLYYKILYDNGKAIIEILSYDSTFSNIQYIDLIQNYSFTETSISYNKFHIYKWFDNGKTEIFTYFFHKGCPICTYDTNDVLRDSLIFFDFKNHIPSKHYFFDKNGNLEEIIYYQKHRQYRYQKKNQLFYYKSGKLKKKIDYTSINTKGGCCQIKRYRLWYENGMLMLDIPSEQNRKEKPKKYYVNETDTIRLNKKAMIFDKKGNALDCYNKKNKNSFPCFNIITIP